MTYREIEDILNTVYRNKQMVAQNDYQNRLEAALHNDKIFFTYYKERNSLITKKATLELGNNDTSEIDSELSKVSRELYQIIRINKIDLNIYYNCKKCRDTGYFQGKPCSCRISLKRDFLRTISNLPKAANGVTFSSSSFDKIDVVQSSTMKKLYRSMKAWADKFETSNNLIALISGDVGVGKTTLAYAFANEVLNSGHSVYYSTAFDLNNLFVDKQFNRLTDKDQYDNVLNAELLVIDDLGTEVMNSIGQEYLFNVIDSRVARGLKIFIATNLNIEEFRNRYDERAASRLTNSKYSFNPGYIEGVDLRKI